MGVAGAVKQFVLGADAVDVDVGEWADVEGGGADEVVDVDGGVGVVLDVLQ